MPLKVRPHEETALRTLASFARLRPGQFCTLPNVHRKTRDLIVTQGYAETETAGGLTLYRITDAGRRAIRADQEASRP